MNLKRTSMLVLMTLSVAVVGQAALPPDTIEFKFAHHLGRVDRFKMTTQTVGTMKMGELLPEQKYSQSAEQEYRTVCKKIYDNGSALYEMTMPLMATKMDAGGMKFSFRFEAGKPVQRTGDDTQMQTMKTSAQMDKIFSAMTNGKYTTLVGPDGTPLKVMGFADTLKKALSDTDNLSSEDKAFSQMFKQMFKDDNMLEMTKGRTDIFPHPGRVRVGDTWDREQEMKMPMFNMLMKTRTQYRLIGIEEFRGHPCAKVEIRQTMQAVPQKGSAKTGTIFDSVDFNMKSKESRGTAYLDYQNSQVVQLRQVQRIMADMIMKKLPGDNTTDARNAPMHIQQSITNSTSVDLVEPETSATSKP